MMQKLVLEKYQFDKPHSDLWVDEEEEIEMMEDKLEGEMPWEIAFAQGEQLANDEMVDAWNDEDDF